MTDLASMLAHLEPAACPGRYVFATTGEPGEWFGRGEYVAIVREDEGTTAVVPQQVADRDGLPYAYVAAMITLGLHSALDAVGLTAAVSGDLARGGISCNVIAGAHHDHLFVPADRLHDALAVLRGLSGG